MSIQELINKYPPSKVSVEATRKTETVNVGGFSLKVANGISNKVKLLFSYYFKDREKIYEKFMEFHNNNCIEKELLIKKNKSDKDSYHIFNYSVDAASVITTRTNLVITLTADFVEISDPDFIDFETFYNKEIM